MDGKGITDALWARPSPSCLSSHANSMNRLRVILGYIGGVLLVASSVAHSLLGWKGLSTSLAQTQAPADLVTGLAIGWHFAGVAMFTFGCIVIWEIANLGRRGSLALWPVLLIGLVYVAFGIWARIVSNANFFMLAFVIPGAILVASAWPTRGGEQVSGISLRSLVWVLALAGLAATACTSRDSTRDGGDTSASGEPVLATPTFGPLGVPVGVALFGHLASAANHWCADFEEHEVAVDDTVTLVWPDSSADSVATVLTRVRKARPGRCAQIRGDTSDIDDPDLGTVYELALADSADSASVAELAGTPAIAIRGSARWTRGPDAFLRADLDGDENPEQARLCTSNEGIHLTLWTLLDSAPAGKLREHRRWRAYQPLGYDVEPSCTARETDDPPEPAGAAGR